MTSHIEYTQYQHSRVYTTFKWHTTTFQTPFSSKKSFYSKENTNIQKGGALKSSVTNLANHIKRVTRE